MTAPLLAKLLAGELSLTLMHVHVQAQAEGEAADFSEQDVDLEAYDSGSDEEAKSPGRWGASSREFTSMQLKQDHVNRCCKMHGGPMGCQGDPAIMLQLQYRLALLSARHIGYKVDISHSVSRWVHAIWTADGLQELQHEDDMPSVYVGVYLCSCTALNPHHTAFASSTSPEHPSACRVWSALPAPASAVSSPAGLATCPAPICTDQLAFAPLIASDLTFHTTQAAVGDPGWAHLPGNLLAHLQAGLRLPDRHRRARVPARVRARVPAHPPLPVRSRVCGAVDRHHHLCPGPPLQGLLLLGQAAV